MAVEWDKIITAAVPVLLGGATGGGLIRYNARQRIRVIQERTQLIGRQVLKLQDLFTKLEVRFALEESARKSLAEKIDGLRAEVQKSHDETVTGRAELAQSYERFSLILKAFMEQWKAKESALHQLPEGKVRVEDPKRGGKP